MNSPTQKREVNALKELHFGVEIVFQNLRFHARKPFRLLNGEKTSSFSKISRYVWTEWKSGDQSNGTGRIFDRLKNLTGRLVHAGQFNSSLHSMELWTARRLNFCTRLKSEFAFFQSLSRLSQLAYFVKCEQTTIELNSSEPYPSSERQRKFRPRLFTSSIKRETMGILTS